MACIGGDSRAVLRCVQHMDRYPHSYLTRFCGVHRVTMRRRGVRRKLHFIVMKNILFTPLKLHALYDLKVTCCVAAGRLLWWLLRVCWSNGLVAARPTLWLGLPGLHPRPSSVFQVCEHLQGPRLPREVCGVLCVLWAVARGACEPPAHVRRAGLSHLLQRKDNSLGTGTQVVFHGTVAHRCTGVCVLCVCFVCADRVFSA